MRYCILIYDGVEPIDLGATFGVLSMARRVDPAIGMLAIAKQAGTVVCANGLRVIADHGFSDAPDLDVIVVIGGPGWKQAAADAATLAYLRALPESTFVAGICTGAMIMAAAGLLNGHTATTKVEVTGDEKPPIDVLKSNYPLVETRRDVAVLSRGRLTSGGVCLGIDGIFYLLKHLHGELLASETARIMEYDRALKANAAVLPHVDLTSAAQDTPRESQPIEKHRTSSAA